MLPHTRLEQGCWCRHHFAPHTALASDKESVRPAAAKIQLRAISVAKLCYVHQQQIVELTSAMQRHLIRCAHLDTRPTMLQCCFPALSPPDRQLRTLAVPKCAAAKLSTPGIRNSAVARDAGSFSTKALVISKPSPQISLFSSPRNFKVSYARNLKLNLDVCTPSRAISPGGNVCGSVNDQPSNADYTLLTNAPRVSTLLQRALWILSSSAVSEGECML